MSKKIRQGGEGFFMFFFGIRVREYELGIYLYFFYISELMI